ncbi:hypothetical protein PYCCODRAFT_1331388, partial [Trametes coccinea BRFM310]
RFAWLKDAWRTQYEFVAQEGAVLKELNDASVPYVPTLICHGDIPGQDTGGREECPLRRHKHYRIAVKEVGMKLVEFKHGKQLLQIIFDCMFAHQQAVVEANIMHRDISGGNILILPRAIDVGGNGSAYMKWTGLLVDWELSKPLKGDASFPRPRQPERTGTWQFMSAAVLDNHSKKLEISDELESFFHVTLYYAVRY